VVVLSISVNNQEADVLIQSNGSILEQLSCNLSDCDISESAQVNLEEYEDFSERLKSNSIKAVTLKNFN